MLIILFLTASAEAVILTVDDSGGANYNYIWDESSGSPLPFIWSSSNFDGFNISGIGTENLTVLQTDLSSTQRIISNNNMTYSTTALPRKLNVVAALNLTDYITMINRGLERAYPGQAFENGQYHVVNWGGQKYVALNGKVDKLAKLVMEQGLTEKKSLRLGETWDVGGGWALTANSIDARAFPRQVWFTLSKDGVKKDDKVVTAGSPDARPIYTYVEKSIGGENDVPLFVTYVDSIFDGTTSDIVELRYTWALSTSVTTINSYTTYGVFRDATVSWKTLALKNSDISVPLLPDATINLIGNIKFKVIDNSTYLKFYPTDEPKLNITASSANTPVGTPSKVIFNVTVNGSPINGAMVNLNGAAAGSGITDSSGQTEIYVNAAYEGTIIADSGKAGYTNGTTSLRSYSFPIAAMGSWSLEENYVLNLTDIDTKAYPRQVRLQLSKGGILVEEGIVTQGSIFKYCPNDCTITTTVDVIFNGTQGNLVKLVNTSQYSESNGTRLFSNVSHLYRSGNFTGISWLLNEGYELKMMDFDISYPRSIWLELFKNNTVIDEAFISWGQMYYYNKSSGSTILAAKVDAIFNGDTSSVVKLTEVNQYSETTGAVLLDNSTHLFIFGEIKRADQPLYEGYTLSVLGIDVHGYPPQTWLRLYKDDKMVDEKIAALGDVYSYENESRTILYSEINFIFAGRPVSALKLDNVTQYSEMNGSKLVSGATYIIVVNGSLFPIPLPTITPIPEYGTYEVRGTVASETASEGAINLSTLPIIWDPQNFAGFFYDLNYDLGKEELQILQPDLNSNQRTIAKGNLVYRTSAQPKMLNVVKYAFGDNIITAAASGLKRTGSGQAFEGGNHYTLGWQGEKYVALNGKVDKLTRLILEHGTSAADKKTLTMGETWHIGDNWTITLQSINARSSPRIAWLVLGRDGVKKDDIFVSSGAFSNPTYTYVEKNISNESDVPLFVTYLDSVFAGATTDMVQLRYTWLISSAVTEIKSGDTYGKFTDATVTNSGKTISIKNSDSTISLTKDTTIDLIGNMKFKVADNDTLRFMPVAMHTFASGIYEIRGAVWNETPINGFGGMGRTVVWDALNFAGLWYDLNTDSFSESLKITELSGRVIPQNSLNYNVSAIRIPYIVTKQTGLIPEQTDGTYTAVGWGGEKHMAIKGKSNKLSKIILEQDTSVYGKKTLTLGETWEVGDGYTLTATSIDAKASPRQVRLTLRRNGVKIDDRVRTSDGSDAQPLYTYVERSVGGENDVPLFITYVDSIFAGATTDMVQLKYTWFASQNVTVINIGDTFGALSVTDVTPQSVTLKNNGSFSLSAGNKITIFGGLYFTVADSAELRFYPSKGFAPLPIPIPAPSVYFDRGRVTMPQNASRSLNLILNFAQNGLSGYNITISLSNASVASIRSVDFPAWATLSSNSSFPSGSVWIKASDLNNEISNGANNVILANVTVRGDNPGYLRITTTIRQMDDDSGAVIDPQTLESYIEVYALKKFPDMIAFPSDPDEDGLYEDINGNGRIDFNDVVLLFDHLEWIMDNEPVESFDFNRNGRIDFADIVKLYEEI